MYFKVADNYKWHPRHSSQFIPTEDAFTTSATQCIAGSISNGNQNAMFHVIPMPWNIWSMKWGVGKHCFDEAAETLKAGNKTLSGIIVGGTKGNPQSAKLLLQAAEMHNRHGIQFSILANQPCRYDGTHLAFKANNGKPSWYISQSTFSPSKISVSKDPKQFFDIVNLKS
jgi:hypothetical protein